jgi:GNAT superfamily N-acetyltransferase
MCEIGNMSGELRWQVGDESARLKFTESETGLTIETIIVPASCRGKGIGSVLVQRLIQCAEFAGKDVYLSARPLGGRTNPERLNRLVRFYKKLGFTETERGVTVCHMVRKSTSGTENIQEK